MITSNNTTGTTPHILQLERIIATDDSNDGEQLSAVKYRKAGRSLAELG
jgi:hypothetical protein